MKSWLMCTDQKVNSLIQKSLCSFISIFYCRGTFHKNDCFIPTATQSFVSYSPLAIVILFIFVIHSFENWSLKAIGIKNIHRLNSSKRCGFPSLKFVFMSTFLTTYEQEKEENKILITFKTSEIIPTYLPTPQTFAFHCAQRKLLASQNDAYCA